jgi:hypothetical protein
VSDCVSKSALIDQPKLNSTSSPLDQSTRRRADFRLDRVECPAHSRAERCDGSDASDEDQGQHDGVFDGRGSVFANEKGADALQCGCHRRSPTLEDPENAPGLLILFHVSERTQHDDDHATGTRNIPTVGHVIGVLERTSLSSTWMVSLHSAQGDLHEHPIPS